MPGAETTLRVLIVEDSEDDAALVLRELRKSHFNPAAVRVDTAADMIAALRDQPWDIILSDYMIPGFGGIEALKIATESGLDLPFVLVSGKVDEQTLVEAMKAGARDFLIKGHLARLGSVVAHELADAATRRSARQSEIEWRRAFDAVHEPMFLHDKDFRILRANRAYAERAGLAYTDIVGRFYWEVFPRGDGPLAGCHEARHAVKSTEEEIVIDTGETFLSHATAVENDAGEYLYSIHTMEDITERKWREEALRTAEARYRGIFTEARDGIVLIDAQTGFIADCNPEFERQCGRPLAELLDLRIWEVRPPEMRDAARAKFEQVRTAGNGTGNIPLQRPDGSVVPVEFRTAQIRIRDRDFLQSTSRDITERLRAQGEIEFKNTILHTQQETSPDAILLVDENDRIISYNRQFIELWRIPRPVAVGDQDALVLESVVDQIVDPQTYTARVRYLNEHRDEKSHEEFLLKDGRVIDRYSAPVAGLEGRYYGRVWYFRDITERKRAQAALEESEHRFRSMIENASDLIIMLDANGMITYASPSLAPTGGYAPHEVVGRNIVEFTHPDDLAAANAALAAVLERPDEPRRAEIRWLDKSGDIVTLESIAKNELANPALRAIVINARDASARLRAEAEIKRYVGELEHAFMQSVTVATTICEMRDPYTVGHERRVAELSVAIGIELGFDASRLEGLQVAGFLHDVGKITVPAEILVKPTKLSPTEFELIKGHAQASYEVLKNVTFPWPVAQIAYQHHERLDGSGYPRGLKGEAILLEARILAVADTVEAMNSHRPYRPGLGIDKALAEIKRGRGSGYDPAVVDACLKVFAEKQFAFST